MATNRILNVKQAAKLLGLSTNTTYKYLNEGKIKAARGVAKGTFRIPIKSIEEFLGSKIPVDQVNSVSPTKSANLDPFAPSVIHVSPPTLAVKIARLVLLISLVLIVIDLLTTKNFSISTQAVRLATIFLFLILTYQYGGFTKK